MREPLDELYEITVWTFDGDVVKVIDRATDDDLDEIEERYGDDPRYIIQVDSLDDV